MTVFYLFKKKHLLKYFLLVDAFSSLFIVNAPIKHISEARCSANALFAFHLKGPYNRGLFIQIIRKLVQSIATSLNKTFKFATRDSLESY